MYDKIRIYTFNSVFISLFVIFTVIPYLGYWQLGFFEITFMHILLLITIYTLYYALNLNMILIGFIYGLIFGLTSLLKAYIFPNVTTFVFGNPLFSVVPRIFVGLFLGCFCTFGENLSTLIIKKASNNKLKFKIQNRCRLIIWTINASLASLFNTCFVLVIMHTLGPIVLGPQFKALELISWIVLISNFLPENIIGAIICPFIIRSIFKLYVN